MLRRFGDVVSQAIAFVGFFVPAFCAIYLWMQFPNTELNEAGYAFVSNYSLGLSEIGISLRLGLNGIALPMFLLAGIVGLAAGMYAIQSSAKNLPAYLMLLLIMQSGLMGTFASIDIVFFFFFHELALIPTFIMIGIWGGRARRVVAMELTIYLTLGAMLSLLGLLAIYDQMGVLSFDLVTLKKFIASRVLPDLSQRYIFGLLLFGFGILVSLWPFHSWAPRGYAAAPTSAAMLHAGVLKKFGLYGLIQIAAPLLQQGLSQWSTLLIWLAIGNIIIIGLVTIAQRDLKQMVGYSSVMHMGYCFLAIASFSVIGVGGAVMLMFAHGLSVALLFMLTNCVYVRSHTFDMDEMGGLCRQMPVLALFFIIAIFASIGLPGLANFWGELTIFIALWEFKPWLIIPATLGVVISSIYGLRAVANVFFGKPTEVCQKVVEEHPIIDLTFVERVTACILVGALLWVGFWPKSVSQSVHHNLSTYVYPAPRSVIVSEQGDLVKEQGVITHEETTE